MKYNITKVRIYVQTCILQRILKQTNGRVDLLMTSDYCQVSYLLDSNTFQ